MPSKRGRGAPLAGMHRPLQLHSLLFLSARFACWTTSIVQMSCQSDDCSLLLSSMAGLLASLPDLPVACGSASSVLRSSANPDTRSMRLCPISMRQRSAGLTSNARLDPALTSS